MKICPGLLAAVREGCGVRAVEKRQCSTRVFGQVKPPCIMVLQTDLLPPEKAGEAGERGRLPTDAIGELGPLKLKDHHDNENFISGRIRAFDGGQ